MTRPRCSVVLVGPRGAGKTTVAAALAEVLGLEHADTDALIAAEVGEDAGSWLARVGEATFRELEERICLEALAHPRVRCLSLGGGAVLSAPVRARLTESGGPFVVRLTAAVDRLVERLQADRSRTPRPALTSLPERDEVAALIARRAPLYAEVASRTLDSGTSSVSECVDAIRAFLPS